MEEETILHKFNITNIKPRSMIGVVAKRNSGKSTLIKDIFYRLRNDFPLGNVFSATEHLNKFYQKFIPPFLIHDDFSEKIMDNVFKRQHKAIEEKWSNTNFFLIFDDMQASSDEWVKSKYVNELFLNGRQYHIFAAFLLQSFKLPPAYRQNLDYIFLSAPTGPEVFDNVFKAYGGFLTKTEFRQIWETCTAEEYSFFVIDNVTKLKKISDKYFYYRADPTVNFKMCSEKVWETQTKMDKQSVRERETPREQTSKILKFIKK
jgi:hypothetical protein